MKKIFICAVIVLSASFFTTASAQIRITNNVDSQPKWGPDGHEFVEYYYLPEIEAYYYVPRQQFIYQSEDGYWTFSSSLPADKKSCDLYSCPKIVINEAGAYRYFDQHKVKYAGYKSNDSGYDAKNLSNKNSLSKEKDKG
jgi:hypothetical protein